MPSQVSFDEKTARRAYQIYEDEGRPEGRALDHWFQAQKQLQDDSFLEQELRTEEAEGGIVPKP